MQERPLVNKLIVGSRLIYPGIKSPKDIIILPVTLQIIGCIFTSIFADMIIHFQGGVDMIQTLVVKTSLPTSDHLAPFTSLTRNQS